MLANVNEDFALEVIDPAVAPETREKPKRKLIVALGGVCGGFLGIFAVFFAQFFRKLKSSNSGKSAFMSKQFSKSRHWSWLCWASPYPLQFARSGVSVLGFDLDPQKVDSINAGKTYLKHFSSESIAEQVDANRLEARPIPPDCPKWKRFLFASPLLWMIIANPISLSFWIPQELLLLILQKACWLLLNQRPIREPRRTNFASSWKKAQE